MAQCETELSMISPIIPARFSEWGEFVTPFSQRREDLNVLNLGRTWTNQRAALLALFRFQYKLLRFETRATQRKLESKIKGKFRT